MHFIYHLVSLFVSLQTGPSSFPITSSFENSLLHKPGAQLLVPPPLPPYLFSGTLMETRDRPAQKKKPFQVIPEPCGPQLW